MPASQGLDHIYLRVDDLDAQLRFFHQQLGLPLSWPARDEAFARYAWVNAGNVQLELWQARSNDDLAPTTVLPCVAGLALWPHDVQASREQLVAAGVACKEPRAWRTPGADGAEALNFTNCLIADASGPACQVFFCEWGPHAPIVPWPKGQPTAERRQHMAAALAQCGGGAVGLVGLRAVHLESPDPDRSARVWHTITGAAESAAPGVALRITRGPELRVAALVFGVRDLARAGAALARLGVGTEHDPGTLWINANTPRGLRLGLISA
ncbi:VOC family protein [Caldimonas mangrovi]|uniref:VOC family protein n=1 Tax=Caldimonas mangrovi TaxID=2944811 RepID=UPI0021752D78|nr:VOC family protein [Caldimonas mangrovi]